MSTVIKALLGSAAMSCALLAGTSQAAQSAGSDDAAPVAVLNPVAADVAANAATNPAAANPLRGKVVDQVALAQQRGGTDAGTLGDVRLNGSVSGNSASNLSTGSNIISDGALAGASGVPMVIQNSGNNVLIQSATIINVTVK